MTAHSFDAAARASPFYTPEHEAFRRTLRRFVAKEIEPFVNEWDEAGAFPRDLYKKAAAVGYIGLGCPERYGGAECDRFMRIIGMQEIARGGSGGGFRAVMLNFNDERLFGAAGAIAFARVCLDEAIAYARERVSFGKPIIQHQVIRHKLVDMAQRVEASQAMLELLTWRLEHGENPVAEICMLKNQASTTLAFCASEAVQIFGGAGFMRGAKVERIYREVKVNAIGAGTEEIMKDLASRQMGL